MKSFFKHILAFIAVVIMAVSVVSCSAINPDYKFGDLTRGIVKTAEDLVELKNGYCSNNNLIVRAVVLNAIRQLEPNYVGICNGNAEAKENSRNEIIDRSGNTYVTSGILDNDRSGIRLGSQWMRIEPSEVRLRSGYDMGPEHLPSLLHSRFGLSEWQNGTRQRSSGFEVFDQYDVADQHEKGLLGVRVASFETQAGALLL